MKQNWKTCNFLENKKYKETKFKIHKDYNLNLDVTKD